jgi:hypothetical protein
MARLLQFVFLVLRGRAVLVLMGKSLRRYRPGIASVFCVLCMCASLNLAELPGTSIWVARAPA